MRRRVRRPCGGGGGAVPTFPTAPGAVGAGPPPPPLPEIGGLAGADPLPEGPQIDAGPEGVAGASEAAGGEQIEAAGKPIKNAEQTAAGAQPSGLLDTIINIAKTAVKSLASGAVSLVEGIVGGVRSGVTGVATTVGSLARTAISGAIGMAKSLGQLVMTGVHAVAAQAKSTARSAASSVLQHVLAAVKQVAGPLRTVVAAVFKPGGALLFEQITAVLHKAMFPLLDALPARIGALSAQLQVALLTAAAKVSGLVDTVANFLTGNVTAVQQALERGVSWVAQRVRSVLGMVDGLLGHVPTVVRGAVSAVTGRILGLARTVLNAIELAAKNFIRAIQQAVIATITAFAGRAQAAIWLIYSILSGVVSRVTARLLRAVAAVQRFRNWLRAAIRSRVQRVVRAVSSWINAQTIKLLLKLIGPQIKAAVAQVKLMFPNGMPAPAQVVDAASKAANQVSARDERDLLQGLLKPEGDHVSFGLTFGASGSDVVGGGGSISANFDAVFDYRRNEIGFFVTPSVAAQGSVGVQAGGGAAGGAGLAWGTVGSFGAKSNDVLSAWGGWSAGAQYGVQAGLFEGFGGSIASGGTIYRSGSVDTTVTVPAIVVPGQTQPGTTVPGTPDRQEHVQLGEVLFPTGVGDVSRALPPGRGTIDEAAQIVLTYPSGHPRGRVTRVYVMGEASPPWRTPRRGATAAEENQDLSERRARNVAAQLEPQLGGVKAEPHGVGSAEALKAGLKEDAPAPERQRAVMTADAVISGTPAQTTPPTTGPGTQITPAVTVPGSAPNPLASGRQAWGWDTSASVAGGGGAEASAAGYGGLTAGYAVPIGKTAVSPLAMGAIRVVVGLAKVFGDLVTGSPLALIRDGVALGVYGIEEVAGVSITKPILDWAIPMPAGAGAGGGGG